MSTVSIVVVAFSCVPGRGSEPGVGWETVQAARRWGAGSGGRVLGVTRSLGRQQIESAAGGEEDVVPTNRADCDWVFIDPPKLVRTLFGETARISFFLWQFQVLRRLRRLNECHGVPIHLVTYATDAVPPVALLATTRNQRVWGPVGSSIVPWKSKSLVRRLERAWKSVVLSASYVFVSRLLLQNDHVLQRLHSLGRKRWLVRPNVVVREPSASFAPTQHLVFDQQLLAVGNLVPGKRVDLAIELLALLPHSFGLVVLGAGPEEASLRDLSVSLGVEDRVVWVGKVPHSEVFSWMMASRLLVHFSEHESAGWVVGEALSLGLPAVVYEGSGADTVCRMSGGKSIIASEPNLLEIAAQIRALPENRSTARSGIWSAERWAEDLAAVWSGL